MKSKILTLCLLLIVTLTSGCLVPARCASAKPQSQQDSRELQLQDMLVLQLLPYMNDRLNAAYLSLLTANPQLYPYLVEVQQVERVNGFRGFDFRITLLAYPTVGPHISVGEDLFTFRISSAQVELVQYKHLEGPDVHEFPPNYLDLLKKPAN